jgi:ferredoxin
MNYLREIEKDGKKYSRLAHLCGYCVGRCPTTGVSVMHARFREMHSSLCQLEKMERALLVPLPEEPNFEPG